MIASSRTRSLRRTCCRDLRRRSWRSTAPGGCAASPERWWVGSASSCPVWCSSWRSLRCFSPARRRPGGSAWVAFKVGALSYGGGFVIIPLMQHDAVDAYGWMTDGQFLNAVALGQVTPGPVVHTVAVVGYAAAGLGGGLLAALVAFAPSFSFILIGAERFDRLRANESVRAFLDGPGPAAIGAIAGAAVPLALALTEAWQVAVLAAAAVALFVMRRGVVLTLIAAGAAGALASALGAPLPG